MYTIMMNPDKYLIKTAVTTIYQNENLVDKLKFILPRTYEGLDIKNFEVRLLYTPPDGKPRSETLNLSDEVYKGNWLCGYLPIDNRLTKVAGTVTIKLVFDDLDQRNLQSGTTTITIDKTDDIGVNIPDTPDDDSPSQDVSHNGFEVVEF